MAVFGFCATSALAQLPLPVPGLVPSGLDVPTTLGNDSQCEGVTGCRNVDIYQQVYDLSAFDGNDAFDLDSLVFSREQLGRGFYIQLDVEVSLGYTAASPTPENPGEGLSTNYRANFYEFPGSVSTKKLVYKSVAPNYLVLDAFAGDPPFQLEIDFNYVGEGRNCADDPETTDTLCFEVDPDFLLDDGERANLLLEIRILSVIAGGAGWMQLDAENNPDDSVSSVFGRSDRPNSFQTSTRGLVTRFPFEVNAASLSYNLFPGQTIAVSNPIYFNFFLSEDAIQERQLFTMNVCLVRDDRNDGNQTTRDWSLLPRLAGYCDWLDNNFLRFPGWQHGRWATWLNPATGTEEIGKYVILIDHKASGVLTGVNASTEGEDGMTFADIFGLTWIYGPEDTTPIDLSCAHYVDEETGLLVQGPYPDVGAPDGAVRDSSMVPRVVGGSHAGPNVIDATGNIVQCNATYNLRARTAIAGPVRYFHGDGNHREFTIQQHVSKNQAWITQISACADNTALVAELNDDLAYLHNRFAQGDPKSARQTGEIMAWKSENSDEFAGCDPSLNLRGEFTASIFHMIFALWDEHENFEVFKCYRPVLRYPIDDLADLPDSTDPAAGPDGALWDEGELLPGFFDCSAPS